MRHKKEGKKLDRNSAQRKALMKSLSAGLAMHEKIQTTETKAKLLKSHFEKLITKAKKDDLVSVRYLKKYLPTEKEVKKMVKEIGPRYRTRNGGYTRIIKIGPRAGDGAPVVQIELV
ncbi:MAG: 50S ribosomal protein L17 [bacterium]